MQIPVRDKFSAMKSLLSFAFLLISLPLMAYDAGSEPVGYYSNGSIRNGVSIPDSGPGYMKLFLHRNRAWATQEMIDMLIESAGAMDKKFPNMDRMQVGDISKNGGGDVTDLHSSHQNGLDVDLTYYRVNQIEQRPNQIDGFAENMVVNNRISRNFDAARNWEFIKKLHESGNVQRIFVDPIIKKEFCRQARMKRELLRFDDVLKSIRPYPNHGDHMHVRLRCPRDARECLSQDEPPAGTGCSGRR